MAGKAEEDRPESREEASKSPEGSDGPEGEAQESHMDVDPAEIKDEKEHDERDEHSEHGEDEEKLVEDGPSDEDKNDEEGEKNAEDAENGAGGEQLDPIFDEILMKPLFERREKSMKELLEAMDEFSPIIPDAVTDYYLAKSGFRTTDHRIKRLLALATQKFVADIASDAYQFSRIRAQTANAAGGSGRGRAGPGSTSGRTVLTMESLSGVLGEYGINAKRPDFYR